MEKFEIIIIGAGPTGLRVAKILAEAGKKVLVLEKNSVVGPKICAGGASPKVFQQGIPEDLIERKFNSIKIHFAGRTYERKSNEGYLLSTLDRENLGQWMAKEAEKSGAKILTNTQVVSIKKDKVILKNNQVYYFDYLIGADGGTPLVRKYLKLPLKFALCFQYTLPQYFKNLEIFYEPKLFGAGYAWIFPHKNSTKIGCGSDLKFFNGNQLKENFHFWLKKMGVNPVRNVISNGVNYQEAKLESAIINYDYRGYQFGNIFLIGEAAGFVSGLNGAGIYPGLISGQEIARKILNPNYRPKITLMLFSQKLQGKLLKILNINQALVKYFMAVMVLYLFFSNRFFNLVHSVRKPFSNGVKKIFNGKL